MNLYINEQAAAMGLAALLGALLGVLYDLLRIVRRHTSSVIATALCDMIFWVVSAAAFFLFTMSVTGGVMRLYTLFGVGVGISLWFFTFSDVLLRVGDVITGAVAAIFRFLFSPFRFIGTLFKKALKKILKITKKLFHFPRKKCIMDVSDTSLHFPREVTHEEEKAGFANTQGRGSAHNGVRRRSAHPAKPRNKRGNAGA